MTEATTTTQPAAATTTEGAATSNQVTESATGAEAAAATQQTTEAQATQPAEGAKPEGGETKPAGAPEKYDFKSHDGQELSPAVLESFSRVAKELNLSQESAQKVIDEMAPALAARNAEALNEARTQWGKDVKADKELGGEKVAENIALANKAFEQFGTPELRALLDATGLGDHPEMIRWANRVGKAISEDGFVAGKNGESSPQSVAQRMYPGMNP